MNLRRYLFIGLICSSVPLVSFSQSGPGGVQSPVFWHKASNGVVFVEADSLVNTWTDQIGDNDATNTLDMRPSFPTKDDIPKVGSNVEAGVLFDGVDDFLTIADDAEINTIAFSNRTIYVVFRAFDATTTQYLFQQGDATDRLSLFISGGNLTFEVFRSGVSVTTSLPITCLLYTSPSPRDA